jgi:hypothetical protein
VAFPPSRHNASIALTAKGSMILGQKKIHDSQFPEEILKKDRYRLKKPSAWL